MAGLLTKILTGVFDPPPDHAAIPVAYLLGVVVLTAVAGATAAAASIRGLLSSRPEALREL
jgi:putative ABC transport system permease protein